MAGMSDYFIEGNLNTRYRGFDNAFGEGVFLPIRRSDNDGLHQWHDDPNRLDTRWQIDGVHLIGDLFPVLFGREHVNGDKGRFGLASFTAEQRTKEIGVRKVLGASVFSIITLLSKDFLKLVLVAIVIASPIAWYTMNRWLQDFAYKIDIAWWMFAGAGLLAVGIALLTVSFQSVKAALTNPVKSLRSE